MPAQPVARGRHVASDTVLRYHWRYLKREKGLLSPFPSKAETEHQSSFELKIFPLMEENITTSFCKQSAKNSDILACVIKNVFINFPIIINRSYFFIEHEVQQNTQVKLYT
jgi:hypothetical protein